MVARTEPVVVVAASTRRAMPKSVIWGSPYSDMRTLAGFTSRWRTPAAWAALRPDATRAPMRTASTGGRAPSALMRSWSEPPGTYGMTRYGKPSAVTPAEKAETMLGWLDSRPMAVTSRCHSSTERSSAPGAERTLTATSRPRPGWWPRYTTPKPPRPMTWRSSTPGTEGGAAEGPGGLEVRSDMAIHRTHDPR